MKNDVLDPCAGCPHYALAGVIRGATGYYQCIASGSDDACPLLINVYERRTGKFVTAQVGGKAALLVDGDQSWFEIDTVVNDESHYAQYNETLLRWESGDN